MAAKTITQLTPSDYWYGDPQWSPDGSFVVVQANRNPEQESARYSINHNYDLWKISLSDRKLEQLTLVRGRSFRREFLRMANGWYVLVLRGGDRTGTFSIWSSSI